MIYTDTIINYSRTDAELEELILFLVLVAGKPANRTAYALEKFLTGNLDQPFKYVRELIKNNHLRSELEKVGTGQYTKIEKSFEQLTSFYTGAKLRFVTPEELERMHGIGPKSSRCFVCWTQKGVRYAMLDTHILRFMREILHVITPKSTPSGKQYKKLEEIFLDFADKSGMNPTELDLQIWKSRRVE